MHPWCCEVWVWMTSKSTFNFCKEHFHFSSKLRPQNTRGAFTKELFSWLMILMFPWYQKFCHAIMIYGAFGELTFLYFLSALLSNLRRFEIYRQYIGADCTRSVSLGSSFFRRLWPLMSILSASMMWFYQIFLSPVLLGHNWDPVYH